MDGRRVDELARVLGSGGSRRTAIKALVVAIGGSVHRSIGIPSGSIGSSAAAAACIQPGITCDPQVRPFGCCPDAVCLAGTDGQFRCCYPAGSAASCDDDSQCCSGFCGSDHRCGILTNIGSAGVEVAACNDDDECPRGSTCCFGLCTQIASDPLNCGTCGWRCPDADCGVAVCTKAVCGIAAAEDGTACGSGGCIQDGTCTDGACRGNAVPDGTPCDDGSPCTLNGVCAAGSCQSVTVANGAPCATTSECMTNGHCLDGACIGEYAPFQTTCTAGGCVNSGYCQSGDCYGSPFPNGTPCDDGNACLEDAVCVSGRCVGTKIRCENYDPQCSMVECNPVEQGCRYAWMNDGSPCGEGGTCINGICRTEGVDPCSEVTCAEGFSCANGVCCFTETICPGAVCCGNFDAERGYSHFCQAGVCCRVHLICGNGCCLGGAEPTSENDLTCTCDTCTPVGQPCTNDESCPGCPQDTLFTNHVCVHTQDRGSICCPQYRACGDVCCSPTEHCVEDTKTCEHAFPRTPGRH